MEEGKTTAIHSIKNQKGITMPYYITLSGLILLYSFTQGVALGCLIAAPFGAIKANTVRLRFPVLPQNLHYSKIISMKTIVMKSGAAIFKG